MNDIYECLKEVCDKYMIDTFVNFNTKVRKMTFNAEVLSSAYAIAVILALISCFALPFIALIYVLMLLFNGELLLQIMFMTFIFIIVFVLGFTVITLCISVIFVLANRLANKLNRNNEE